MDNFIELIGNFGFPIVVSAFLLIRIENRLNKINQNLIDLMKLIVKDR